VADGFERDGAKADNERWKLRRSYPEGQSYRRILERSSLRTAARRPRRSSTRLVLVASRDTCLISRVCKLYLTRRSCQERENRRTIVIINHDATKVAVIACASRSLVRGASPLPFPVPCETV